MAILITGGTGFLGRNLATALHASGEKVFLLSRSIGQTPPVENIELVRWDGRSPQGWGHLIQADTVVINLAGENIGSGLWTDKKKVKIRTSRIQAGKAVSEAIRLAKNAPQLLIQASGVGYYGTSLESIFDEDSPVGNDWLAMISQEWEDSTKEVESLGVRRVIIRTSPVLNRSEGILLRYMLPFQFFAGGALGTGKQWVPWIHLKDFIEVVRFVMQNKAAIGAFNLVAPDVIRYEDFGKTLAKVMNRPYWLPVPEFALRLVLGEMSTLVLDGQHVVPKRLLEMGYQFQYPDVNAAFAQIFGRK